MKTLLQLRHGKADDRRGFYAHPTHEKPNQHLARFIVRGFALSIGFHKPIAGAKNLPRARVSCWLSKPTPDASNCSFLATGSANLKPTPGATAPYKKNTRLYKLLTKVAVCAFRVMIISFRPQA
jgi:hypothetical protein